MPVDADLGDVNGDGDVGGRGDAGGAGDGGGRRRAESHAREICLRQLAVRPRTRAELAKALTRRGVDEAVAESVLSRLGDVGLIDDAAFAELFVESRQGRRGLGRLAIAHQLRQRGIDKDLTEAATADIGPDVELASAHELISSRSGSMVDLPPEVRARRLAGLLARRGYARDVSRRAIREALDLDEEFLEDDE